MSTITRFSIPILLTFAAAGPAAAQGSRSLTACEDGWQGGNRSVNICESREFTLPAEDTLQIDASPNGSVSVTGWDRDEVQVRAQVRSWSRDEGTARDRLNEIGIDTDGKIRAFGPDVQSAWWPFSRRQGGWTVSFEIMAPHDTDLWVESVNGRISVAEMHRNVDAETINGAISLTDVSADVRGRTVNGGISADLAGATIDGDTVDLHTTNGAIVLRIPEGFSARLDIETVNGGVRSDFPVTREGRGNREVSAILGDGGPLIRARTVNGGVQIQSH
jgi:hypothetical protein